VRQGRRDVAEAPAGVPEEVEAHDLEDPVAAPWIPGLRVDVAHVAEFAHEPRAYAGLFRDLALGRLLGLLAGADVALGQGPHALGPPARPDRGEEPPSAEPAHHDAPGRELPLHAPTL
jgi:hypothetical protein